MKAFLIKEDFLDKRCFDLVDKEITTLLPELQPKYYLDTEAWRLNLDDKYVGKRNMSAILNLFNGRLYSEEMLKFVSNNDDLSYKLYNLGHTYYTCITQIREEREYRWHTDIEAGANKWNNNFMAWIWYHNDGFEGGILEVKVGDNIEKIKPKKNMLVLLPAYRVHRVTKPIYKDNNYRTTVNGFMSIQ